MSGSEQPPVETVPEGKYVYCVIRSETPLSFGPLGLGPEPAEVHTIHFRDICAVVSNTFENVGAPARWHSRATMSSRSSSQYRT